MAKSGTDLLREADTIHKEAVKIQKRDPSNAEKLKKAARAKTSQAVKRFATRVKRKKGTSDIGVR
jgi:hypothetical protein